MTEIYPSRGLAAVRGLLELAKFDPSDGLQVCVLDKDDKVLAEFKPGEASSMTLVIRALEALAAEVERHLVDGHGPEPLSPRIERQ